MGKKENHQQDLIRLFETFFKTDDAEKLKDYLVSNSNLPGPRGNLELAEAFGDVVEDQVGKKNDGLWKLCAGMAEVPADEAPVNDPGEFIPFCGTVGLGAIGSVSPEQFGQAITALKRLANDPRWRMREAVGMGLQRLMAKRTGDTIEALAGWITDSHWLEMRAVAAGVAEPALLTDKDTALSALKLHQHIIDRMLATNTRKSENFRVLRKALGYTLSVVIYAVPQEGFAYMNHLIDSGDKDMLWIVKENLKKNRLTKNFPEEVTSTKKRLK